MRLSCRCCRCRIGVFLGSLAISTFLFVSDRNSIGNGVVSACAGDGLASVAQRVAVPSVPAPFPAGFGSCWKVMGRFDPIVPWGLGRGRIFRRHRCRLSNVSLHPTASCIGGWGGGGAAVVVAVALNNAIVFSWISWLGLGRGGSSVLAIAEPLPSRTRVCTGGHCEGGGSLIHFAVAARAATGAPVPGAKPVR